MKFTKGNSQKICKYNDDLPKGDNGLLSVFANIQEGETLLDRAFRGFTFLVDAAINGRHAVGA